MKILFACLLLVLASFVSQAQTLSDNFNDGVPDTALWNVGTGFVGYSFTYTPDVVTVSEASGGLVFTQQAGLSEGGANAYSTIASYDVFGKRVSAKLSRAGGLQVYLAVGSSPSEVTIVSLENGGSGTMVKFQTRDLDQYDQYDFVYIAPANYDPAQQVYLGLRFTRRGVYCETSPDGVVWTTVGLLKERLIMSTPRRWNLVGACSIRMPERRLVKLMTLK